MDEVRKAGKEARKMKKAAACGCCGEGLVGKNPTVLLMERRSHGGKLRCDSTVECLGLSSPRRQRGSGRLSLSSRLTSFQDAGAVP